MTEQAAVELRPEEPTTYITDPVKAEHVAYGEKPYQEQAIALGQMAMSEAGKADGNNEQEVFDLATYQKDYAKDLRNAKEGAILTANQAGDAAGQAYDSLIAAQKKLNNLSASH